MITIPIYTFLIIYALFLVVFLVFLFVDFYHIFESASVNATSIIFSTFIFLSTIFIIIITGYLLQNTIWSTEIVIFKAEWFRNILGGGNEF